DVLPRSVVAHELQPTAAILVPAFRPGFVFLTAFTHVGGDLGTFRLGWWWVATEGLSLPFAGTAAEHDRRFWAGTLVNSGVTFEPEFVPFARVARTRTLFWAFALRRRRIAGGADVFPCSVVARELTLASGVVIVCAVQPGQVFITGFTGGRGHLRAIELRRRGVAG